MLTGCGKKDDKATDAEERKLYYIGLHRKYR